MTNKWELMDALPDGLDETQAVIYREVEQDGVPRLGGRHLLFEDEVWQQRADGRWQRSVMVPEDFAAPRWQPVDA